MIEYSCQPHISPEAKYRERNSVETGYLRSWSVENKRSDSLVVDTSNIKVTITQIYTGIGVFSAKPSQGFAHAKLRADNGNQH